MKICIVSSGGGHLFQMDLLRDWWGKYERFWVTFEKKDAFSLLKDEKKYWAFSPTNRNVINLIRNTFVAFRVLKREKPDIIVSAGAGVAVPFFWLSRFFGCKTVYIEIFDRINSPSLSGRLVYHFSDIFIIQWEELREFYPRGVMIGQAL